MIPRRHSGLRWPFIAVLVGLTATCSRSESPVVVGPRGTEPELRIALGVGMSETTLGGSAALAVAGADGARRAEIPAGAKVTIAATSGGLRLTGALSWSPSAGERLSFTAIDPDSFVRVGGRDYRGSVLVVPGLAGLMVINRVRLESYLAGVVSAEMGRRDSTERQALLAQAVVSRTYAVRNRGRWETLGFDFYATVVDQAYGGVAAETPLGWSAVTATGGEVVTYQGTPIDAFFFSTCGGRTAAGPEVFVNADRPYLVSIEDTDPSGQAYCRISPRFDWRVEWSAEALRDILKETVPATLGPAVSPRAVIQSVEVTERSASGRVARLTIGIDGRAIPVNGPAVRQVLRPVRDEWLRSTNFTLVERTAQGRLVRLVAEGHGAGHGVGLCQWGAVGRARAGQNYRDIISAYFPETDLERLY